MSKGTIALAGVPYAIVDPTRVKAGKRSYVEEMEPEQPLEGAGGRPVTKSWKLSGVPMGKSRQQFFGDALQLDYADNLDHEYGVLTSAAKRNAVTLTALTDGQFGVPISDVSKTNWAEGAGNTNGNAFDELDEGISTSNGGPADDATTYWTTTSAGFANRLEVNLTSLTDPGVDTGHVMRVRIRASSTSVQVNFALLQGAYGVGTEITSFGTFPAAADTWQTLTLAVPEASAANITDYTDLNMMVWQQSAVGTLDLSATELETTATKTGNVISIDNQFGYPFIARGAYITQLDSGLMTEVENNDRTSIITDTVGEWQDEGIVAYGTAKDIDKRTAADSDGATYSTIAGADATKLAVALDRLWLVDAGKATGADKGKLKYTEESAALTAAALSNGFFATDPSATITGLFWTGVHAIVGHTRGVNSFTDAGKQASLLNAVQDIVSSANGARADSEWGWSYVATVLGLYAIHTSALIANPVGPGEGDGGEAFEGPIDGYPTAVRFFKESLYVAYLNPDGTTYVFKGKFDSGKTPGTGQPKWYAFHKYAATEVHSIGAVMRTNPTLMVGEGENISYYTLSTRAREIADANYEFGTLGGDGYLTTLMLPVGLVGNLRWAKFLTENCDANNTWQLSVAPDEGSYVTVGSTVTSDGVATVRPVTAGAPDNTSSFNTLKPKLTQVAASESAPPQIRGDLTISYDERAEQVRKISTVIEAYGEDLAVIQAFVDAGQKTPVTWRNPTDTDVDADRYAYVTEAVMEDLKNPEDQGIRLTIWEWPA